MFTSHKNGWSWIAAGGLLATFLLVLTPGTPGAQAPGSNQKSDQKPIQLASPIPPQLPDSSKEEKNLIQSLGGAELFRTYCAVCHGKDATGDGPAASALKKAVPDLTRISQRHRGEFPLAEVQLTISGDVVPSPAHGSREMPIWGPIFSQIAWDQDLGKVRIYNLAKHIESLQKK